MTGNLSIQSSLYPSLYLLPTYDNTKNRIVFEGSYAGAASFSAWDDSSGNNRRMLEVRNASYEDVYKRQSLDRRRKGNGRDRGLVDGIL